MLYVVFPCRKLVLSVGLIIGWSLFSFTVHAGLWATGYYPGYRQLENLPASKIDFTALTHIIHFSIVPNSNGTTDNGAANEVTSTGSANLISAAHAAGVKVLICVGDGNSGAGFEGATGSTNLTTFVNNIVNFMTTYGYDGIDIDWEPLLSADTRQYTNFINTLRTTLNGINPRPMLTAAATAESQEPAMFAELQSQFDQINVETYDMAGNSVGWVTWFNAPILSGGFRFPSDNQLIPSADTEIGSYISAGVAPGKLSIGLAFYGYIETDAAGTTTGGATQPLQFWTNAPTITDVTYEQIIGNYFQSNLYHWDTNAEAPYLSITNANATNDMFITYDDQRSCQAKVSYAINKSLGGVMMWELGQDHPASGPDPLLEAVKQAMNTQITTTIQPNGNDILINFNNLALGDYRVEWTSNLAEGAWNTVAITNVPGASGMVQVTDPGALINSSARYYRVVTPP